MRLGKQRDEEDRGDQRGDAAQRDRAAELARMVMDEQAGHDEAERRPEHADHAEEAVRRAARLRREQLDTQRAERDPAGARGDDRRGRHHPDQRAAGQEEHHLRRRRDGERDRRDRSPAAHLGQATAEHEPEEAGKAGCHRAKQRDAAVREVMDVGEVLVRELRRRRAEDVEQEGDRGEEDESAPVTLVPNVSHPAAIDVGSGQRLVAAGLGQPPPDHRREQDRERAERERDAPRLATDVGERQDDHGDREAEAAGEREHRCRVGAAPSGRLFDDGDGGDRRGRDEERVGGPAHRSGRTDSARTRRRRRRSPIPRRR